MFWGVKPCLVKGVVCNLHVIVTIVLGKLHICMLERKVNVCIKLFRCHSLDDVIRVGIFVLRL